MSVLDGTMTIVDTMMVIVDATMTVVDVTMTVVDVTMTVLDATVVIVFVLVYNRCSFSGTPQRGGQNWSVYIHTMVHQRLNSEWCMP
jgi:hypothetical protein